MYNNQEFIYASPQIQTLEIELESAVLVGEAYNLNIMSD